MTFTDIDIDAIEASLPAAALNMRAKLIEEAVERILIWLTPDPKKNEVVSIIAYKSFDIEQKFPFDIVESRKLIEKMFDDNMSLVFIEKAGELITKGLFSKPKNSIVIIETRNYLFTKLAIDIKREVDAIKELLSALRNPRVVLTVEEHKTFVSLLNKLNINLADYYI
jgi:hypothetical protein